MLLRSRNNNNSMSDDSSNNSTYLEVCESSVKFRDWMSRKRRRTATPKTFGFFEFDQDYSETEFSSSSPSEEEEEEGEMAVEVKQMTDKERLFVELTNGTVEDAKRHLEACEEDVNRAVNRYFENPIPSPPKLRSQADVEEEKVEIPCSCEGDGERLEDRCASCVSEILGEASSFLVSFREPFLRERRERKKANKVTPTRSKTKIRRRRRLRKAQTNRVSKRKRDNKKARPPPSPQKRETEDEDDSDDDIPLAQLYRKVNIISNDIDSSVEKSTKNDLISKDSSSSSSSSSSEEEEMSLAALYYKKTGKKIKSKVKAKSLNENISNQADEDMKTQDESVEDILNQDDDDVTNQVSNRKVSPPPPPSSSSSSSSSDEDDSESMSLAEIARRHGLEFSRATKRRKTTSSKTKRSKTSSFDPKSNSLYTMLLEAKARCDADHRIAPTMTTTTTTSSSSSSKRKTSTNSSSSEQNDRSNMTKFVWSVANQTPNSIEEMSRIEGMGTERMRRYARAFMAVLRRHKMSEITTTTTTTTQDEKEEDIVTPVQSNINTSSSIRVPSAIRDIYNNSNDDYNNEETHHEDIVITASRRRRSSSSSSSESSSSSSSPTPTSHTFPRRMPVLVWFPETDTLPQYVLSFPLDNNNDDDDDEFINTNIPNICASTLSTSRKSILEETGRHLRWRLLTCIHSSRSNINNEINECKRILCNILKSVQDVLTSGIQVNCTQDIITDILNWCNSLKSMWNKVWICASSHNNNNNNDSKSKLITLCMAWSQLEMKLVPLKDFEIYARILIRRLFVLTARCGVPNTSLQTNRNDVMAVWRLLCDQLDRHSEGSATFWELLKDEMTQLRQVPDDMDAAKKLDTVSPFSTRLENNSEAHANEFCWEILLRLAPLYGYKSSSSSSSSSSSPPSWQLLSLLTKRGIMSNNNNINKQDHLRELLYRSCQLSRWWSLCRDKKSDREFLVWTELVGKYLAHYNLGSRSHRCHCVNEDRCCVAIDCTACKCHSREWDENVHDLCTCDRPALCCCRIPYVLRQREGHVCEIPAILLRRDGTLMYVAVIETMLRRSGRGMLRMISSLLRNIAKENEENVVDGDDNDVTKDLFGGHHHIVSKKEKNQQEHTKTYAQVRRRVVLLLVLAKIAPPNQLNNLRRNMYAHLHNRTLNSSQIAILSQASVALYRISVCPNNRWNFSKGTAESSIYFLSLMLQGVCGNYFTGPLRIRDESMLKDVRLNLSDSMQMLNLLRLVLDCCYEVLRRAEHVPTQHRVVTYERFVLCQLASCVSAPLESMYFPLLISFCFSSLIL